MSLNRMAVNRLRPGCHRVGCGWVALLVLFATAIPLPATPCVTPPARAGGLVAGGRNRRRYHRDQQRNSSGRCHRHGSRPERIGVQLRRHQRVCEHSGLASPARPPTSPWKPGSCSPGWIRPGGLSAGQRYIVFKQNTRSSYFEEYALTKTRVSGLDYLDFQVTSAGGQGAEVTSVSPVTTGVWYHVACVRGSNFLQLYFNGQLERQAFRGFCAELWQLPALFRLLGSRLTGIGSSRGCWTRCPSTTGRWLPTRSPQSTRPGRRANARWAAG